MVLNRKTYKWFYDHIYSYYYDFLVKWFYLPFGGETKCREALIAHIHFSPGERILDMCCGTGGATSTILTKAGEHSQVIGIDFSSGQLRVASRRPELSTVQFVGADGTQAPFRDHTFDKVFITNALYGMPRAIRLQVLSEAQRLLTENGAVFVLELDEPGSLLVRLFIGLWFFLWLPFNFPTPARRDMLKSGLTEELRAAGFKQLTKVSKYRGIFQVLQGVRRPETATDLLLRRKR